MKKTPPKKLYNLKLKTTNLSQLKKSTRAMKSINIKMRMKISMKFQAMMKKINQIQFTIKLKHKKIKNRIVQIKLINIARTKTIIIQMIVQLVVFNINANNVIYAKIKMNFLKVNIKRAKKIKHVNYVLNYN